MQPPRCSLIVLPWHAAHVVDCSCTHASVSATHSHRLHFMADHEAIFFLFLPGFWRYLALSGAIWRIFGTLEKVPECAPGAVVSALQCPVEGVGDLLCWPQSGCTYQGRRCLLGEQT